MSISCTTLVVLAILQRKAKIGFQLSLDGLILEEILHELNPPVSEAKTGEVLIARHKRQLIFVAKLFIMSHLTIKEKGFIDFEFRHSKSPIWLLSLTY